MIVVVIQGHTNQYQCVGVETAVYTKEKENECIYNNVLALIIGVVLLHFSTDSIMCMYVHVRTLSGVSIH